MKAIRWGGIVGIAIGCLALGYLCGTQFGRTESPKNNVNVQAESKGGPEDKTKAAESVSYQGTIAVVNMDTGTIKQDTPINYGTTLTAMVPKDIKLTGLEDARNGIETGAYSAYIIIPANFSQNVATINDKPEKSILTYAVGTGLTGTQREDTIAGVESMFRLFGDNLSQVYLSSIMKEYHEAQNSADSIMKRDKADTETLQEVAPEDLIALIPIPELKTAENKITSLDLSANNMLNQNKVADIDGAYKTFIAKGEQDLDVIKGSSVEVSGKVAETQGRIDTLNGSLNEVSFVDWNDADQAAAEDLFYSQKKDKLTAQASDDDAGGILTQYTNSVEEHNKDSKDKIADFNTNTKNVRGAFEYTEDKYRAFLNTINTFQTDQEDVTDSEVAVNVSKYTYEFCTSQQLTAVKNALAQEIKRLDDTLVATGGTSEMGGMSPEEYADTLLAVQGIGTDSENVDAFIPTEEIDSSSLLLEEDFHTDMQQVDITSINGEIDELTTKATEGRTARNTEIIRRTDDFKGTTENLKGKMGTALSSYMDLSVKQDIMNKDFAAYNMLSYINDSEISGFVSELSNNVGDIEKKVGAHDEEYNSYVKNVYDTTGENIDALQKSVEEGQKQSESRLESGLFAAKESRLASNKYNISQLSTLVKRLPYTRVGEVENKEVFEFIASPISWENRSEAGKLAAAQQKTSGQAAAGESVKTTGQTVHKEQTGLRLPVWIIIGVLIIAVLVGIILFKRRKNYKEEF